MVLTPSNPRSANSSNAAASIRLDYAAKRTSGGGASAAIATTIFNAAGKRIRELPITLDKLL